MLNDARQLVARSRARVVIGGDLNTHNHGVARLLPMLTGDDHFLARAGRGDWAPRWREWGASEAEWWQENVFDGSGLLDPFAKNDGSHNTWLALGPLKVWGGKLDWLLYSAETCACVAQRVSDGGTASDHPFLRIDVRPRESAEGAPAGAPSSPRADI